MPKKIIKKVAKKTIAEKVEEKIDFTTIEGVCLAYKLEYREGVTRLIDVAKQLGAHYEDGYTLLQIIEQVPKKKNS